MQCIQSTRPASKMITAARWMSTARSSIRHTRQPNSASVIWIRWRMKRVSFARTCSLFTRRTIQPTGWPSWFWRHSLWISWKPWSETALPMCPTMPASSQSMANHCWNRVSRRSWSLCNPFVRCGSCPSPFPCRQWISINVNNRSAILAI